jgi:hypothetical protein
VAVPPRPVNFKAVLRFIAAVSCAS